MWMRLFCCGLVALVATPGGTAADCAVDQEQELLGPWVLVVGNGPSGDYVGSQTFEAGVSGVLDEIRLHGGVSSSAPGPGPLLLEIRSTTGGLPSGPALLSEAIAFASLPPPGLPGEFVVDLSSHGLEIEAGELYAMSVGVAEGAFLLRLRGHDPYSAGTMLSRELPGDDWESMHPLDAFFRVTLCAGAVSAPEGKSLESWGETKSRYR